MGLTLLHFLKHNTTYKGLQSCLDCFEVWELSLNFCAAPVTDRHTTQKATIKLRYGRGYSPASASLGENWEQH